MIDGALFFPLPSTSKQEANARQGEPRRRFSLVSGNRPLTPERPLRPPISIVPLNFSFANTRTTTFSSSPPSPPVRVLSGLLQSSPLKDPPDHATAIPPSSSAAALRRRHTDPASCSTWLVLL